MTDTQRGLMLAFTGIIILSLDSLMVKLVAAAPLDLLFWRGAMQAGCLCSYLLIFDRQQLSKQLRQLNPLTITVSLLFAASSICFIEALAHTPVTSTLVIINTAPLFTAIIAFIFLREKLPLYSVLAIAATVGGVWIIFSHAPGESQLKGDLYALVTALSTAVYLVSMRFTQGKNTAALIIMAGIFIALFALAAGATPSHVQGKHLLFAIFLGGVVVPVSYMFISNAPAIYLRPKPDLFCCWRSFSGHYLST
ncbi:hypothetical protein NFHSH190041_08370 [Shewanella sp. NFH-SH190041]|uniref:DMT family transporter n=1 Tax=Shewanella sp. NFH-SH190041 TaxID=2950245 RepID=UPI0021C3D6F5|nr:DMT family transporter [Shewanella sp. NFH-SH190041]BDM63385.1 hypothetical protein NFHSH190041_08370 [Shewanella sp. NFH-SH190041]